MTPRCDNILRLPLKKTLEIVSGITGYQTARSLRKGSRRYRARGRSRTRALASNRTDDIDLDDDVTHTRTHVHTHAERERGGRGEEEEEEEEEEEAKLEDPSFSSFLADGPGCRTGLVSVNRS